MPRDRLDSQIARRVVNYCNRDLVPNATYDANMQFESEWFEEYFSFLGNEKLQKHVGNAFYQARFMYKLMSALRLPSYKNQGIVKFQIIQYASIYEAILDYLVERDFKREIMEKYGDTIYTPISALSRDTKITYSGETVFTCKQKKRKKNIKSMSITERVEFAVEKGIITDEIKDRICNLYDLRNNVHILKATKNDYIPTIKQAKEAFQLMQDFVVQTKRYCSTQTEDSVT